MSESTWQRDPAIPGVIARANVLILPAIILLGLALRLVWIDAASFWHDEVFSVIWARHSWRFLWTSGMALETNPPLYVSLLKPWVAWLGQSEAAVRLLSVVASTATIPVVYLLGREVGSRRTGQIAALLFALAPVQISYAQEARAYAFLPLFAAIAIIGLLRYATAPRTLHLATYAVAAVLLIYTHATSVFTLAALNLAALLVLKRPAIPRLVVANIVVGLVSLPELVTMLTQTGADSIAWIPKPDLVGVLNVMNVLVTDPVSPQTIFRICTLLSAATLLILAILRPWARLSRAQWALLVGAPIIFLLVTFAISFRVPVLMPRITIWLSVPLCVLAARVLPRARWFAVPLAACILLGLHGVYAGTVTIKEDWRGLMAELGSQFRPDDMFVVGPSTSTIAPGFYGGPQDVDRWQPSPEPGSTAHLDALHAREVDLHALAEAIRSGRRVWLIFEPADLAAHGAEALRALPPPHDINQSHMRLTVFSW
jgi:4-amino-4-deoxy-L-arabinose transferase-like glycosyltransferase